MPPHNSCTCVTANQRPAIRSPYLCFARTQGTPSETGPRGGVGGWGRWRGIAVINPSNPLNRARSRRAILTPAGAPAPLQCIRTRTFRRVPLPWEVIFLPGKLSASYAPASRVNPINHSNTRNLGTSPVQPRGNATQPPSHSQVQNPARKVTKKAGGQGAGGSGERGGGGACANRKFALPINPRVSPFFIFLAARSLVPVPRRNRSGTWTYGR